ncbi:hypothetical protein BDB01DRAFT_836329 [Pilobolus umbonatus]|nr:hypothetical protein BDB01DRAFT_836329 [Pilobolus umbonatus]
MEYSYHGNQAKRQKTDQEVVSGDTLPDSNSVFNTDSTSFNAITDIPDDFFLFVDNNDANITQASNDSLQPPIKAERPNTVFTLVVGGRVFRLSWSSLKSDGPNNFFLKYFRNNSTKVMHIDRDPDVFNSIVLHLRGYHIQPKNDLDNQCLLADAHYYGLERLKKILQEYLFVNVGGRTFRLPWDLFQKDGSRNFFTGPLMFSLFSPHVDNAIAPPIYIDRDPDIFEDIINHLRGYTISIKNEIHRKNLLKDAKYYVFKQLIDKLLSAHQSVAGFGEGGHSEVLLLLQDIRIIHVLEPKCVQLGIKVDKPIKEMTHEDWSVTQLQYRRVSDDPPHVLLIQISNTRVQLHKYDNGCIKLTYEMNAMDMNILDKIANITKATNGVSKEICIDIDCAIILDDNEVRSLEENFASGDNDLIDTTFYSECCEKCDRQCNISQLVLQRSICSIHLLDNRIVLNALRLDAISSRYKLNKKRQFLPT